MGSPTKHMVPFSWQLPNPLTTFKAESPVKPWIRFKGWIKLNLELKITCRSGLIWVIHPAIGMSPTDLGTQKIEGKVCLGCVQRASGQQWVLPLSLRKPQSSRCCPLTTYFSPFLFSLGEKKEWRELASSFPQECYHLLYEPRRGCGIKRRICP